MDILQGVLDENIYYYRSLEKEILSRLISLPTGSIKKRKIKNKIYYYLQYREGAKVIQKYLGKLEPVELKNALKERKTLEKELKKVRSSLKLLRQSAQTEVLEPLRNILYVLTKHGLWDQGAELIGSWCFKVYQDYMGVQRFPLRTEDIDILIPLPYKGKDIKISELLKELGFREGFNPDGSITFYKPGIRVEFLVPEKGRGTEKAVQIKKLSLHAQALRFVDILLQEPEEIKIARGVKVKVPSLPSFLIHKLIVSQSRKQKADMLKDLEQAIAVAGTVLQSKSYMSKVIKLLESIPGTWQKKAFKGLDIALKEIPLQKEVIEEMKRRLIKE